MTPRSASGPKGAWDQTRRAALDERRESVSGAQALDEKTRDAVSRLGEAGPRGPGEAGLDLVAVEPGRGDGPHELRDLGLLESEQCHVEIAFLRYSAWPT